MIAVDALSRAAVELEPLPPTISKLAGLVADDDSDIEDIAQVVNLDEALTARLLRMANSAASAARTPITTVRLAVVRLGSGTLLSLATASSVQKDLGTAVPGYRLSEGDLWRHSVASAVAAEAASEICPGRILPESYSAALLHDIGKLVVGRFVDADVQENLAREIAENGTDPLLAEMKVLGRHHAKIGGMVAKNWGLPETIVAGVTHHHKPSAGRSPVADAVHLANFVAHTVTETAEDQAGFAVFEPDVAERLGCDEGTLEKIFDRTTEKLVEVFKMYG